MLERVLDLLDAEEGRAATISAIQKRTMVSKVSHTGPRHVPKTITHIGRGWRQA
jgi:hypothetical protein